jgi:hypothetical protein
VAAFEHEPVDVICFGHSHQPVCRRRDRGWLVNPGSPTDKRTQARYSYAILTIERGRVMPRLVFFPSSRPSPRRGEGGKGEARTSWRGRGRSRGRRRGDRRASAR